MYTDLHIHSHYSDGTYSPTEIVQLAEEKGLQNLALTDHSTLQGLEEFKQAVEKSSLLGILGVEISASFMGSDPHILGYCIDENDGKLQQLVRKLARARRENTKRIVKKLSKQGR